MRLGELRRDLRFTLGLVRRRPFSVLLQVTNRCNMKCDFCDFWPNGVSPKEELSIEEYGRIEEQLAGIGAFLVSLEGGEPFVRPDLVEIVRTFGVRHLPVLYTNGWYVTPENARELFDAGLANVGVSIDYPDAERHDRRRATPGAWEQAWRAVEALRDAAPHGGRQVHAITVLMEDNAADLEGLLRQSEARGVGHVVTLLSTWGFRRAPGARMPAKGVSEPLLDLWTRYPHFRIFRDYLEGIDAFLSGGEIPTCRAGRQSFNIDHVGNVSVCIEMIGRPVGSVRSATLADLLEKMRNDTEVPSCQRCWTLCRGFAQTMGNGGSLAGWKDLGGRMRSW